MDKNEWPPRTPWPRNVRGRRVVDITGDRFGETVVQEYWGRDPLDPSKLLWRCLCDCGVEHLARGGNLKGGNTLSCGHLHAGKRATEQHGRHATAEYSSWVHMRKRCADPSDKKYPMYGGAGITVCQRWQDSFSNFIDDMGEMPEGKTTIDRIDPTGNYEPGNCRWASTREQNLNLRTVMKVEFRDEGMVPVVVLAERFGITKNALKGRVRKGKSIEDAIAMGPSIGKPRGKQS